MIEIGGRRDRGKERERGKRCVGRGREGVRICGTCIGWLKKAGSFVISAKTHSFENVQFPPVYSMLSFFSASSAHLRSSKVITDFIVPSTENSSLGRTPRINEFHGEVNCTHAHRRNYA